MRDPLSVMAKQMMRNALRSGAQQSVNSGVHEAGLRKAAKVGNVGKAKEDMGAIKDMTHEQKKMSIRATALIGLVFAMALESFYPERYSAKSESTLKMIKTLWDEIQDMPHEAKFYVLNSLAAFKSAKLEDRFGEILSMAGVSISGGKSASQEREDF